MMDLWALLSVWTLESIRWSAALSNPLAFQEPRKACFLSLLGICTINDVVNDEGYVLTFPQACHRYGLGLHHRKI